MVGRKVILWDGDANPYLIIDRRLSYACITIHPPNLAYSVSCI